MNLTVHQTITINQLRVENVNNSSVLQIGSAGSIRSYSQLLNTGGFTQPAPQLDESALSLVPLPHPT
ncbi:spore germination protein GerPB [Paenibacillus beijingensis]|uniref:Spore gernimation protein n=1 Tax=Paenibacillus beijingensis TaxID=1126833 RepID=A0A0D5NQ52_9BACL|nr:spore germination protein GerPB [Paenibacillus beijingensis]AJY77295.1 spore gernimation protein [Paenibacillus beijingensis]